MDSPKRRDWRAAAPDQLSPGRALQDSLGASASQRIGDNGPLANPTVSFPGEEDPPDEGPPDR
jgi:hypothetical protein